MTVRFEPDGHRYLDDNGNEYLSVTKLISRFFTFDRKAVAEKVSQMPQSRYFGLSIEAILVMWDDTAEAGTEFHKCIQNYIETGVISAKYFHSCSQFASQFKNPLQAETVAWDESLRIAGTVDITEDCVGYLREWDIKTSRRIDPEKHLKFSVQLEIYRRLKTLMTGMPNYVGGVIWFPDLINNPKTQMQLLRPLRCDDWTNHILNERKKELCQLVSIKSS